MRAIPILLLALASCGDKDTDDTGTTAAEETGLSHETGDTDDDTQDTGETDDTGDTGDTAPPEVPLDGLGAISGDCGVLDDELTSADPARFLNAIDFGEIGFDYDQLSPGGQEVYDDGNLGGSSIESEVVSYEVLYRCELAELLKTEAEIEYIDDGGKKTDLLVAIGGVTIGVSVTRAYAYPPDEPYTIDQAVELLEGKLSDVIASSENVASADRWQKQILHVIAYTPEHTESVKEAWDELDSEVQADTILLVTTTDGDDEFVY